VRTRNGLLAVGAGLAAGAAWWRTHPSAMPYWQRAFVQAPHPFITRARLLEALSVPAGSRVLEIGPGTGYYSLPVAERLGPAGHLELLDLQREMLDHIAAKARERRVDSRMVFTQGDAQALPFDDASFDAAYIVMALGEVPDQIAVLRQLARVVRTDGRIVVGELALDPHVVLPGALAQRASAAGLGVERRLGPSFGCFSVLVHAGQPSAG
jgi:ubiquinone/menaquinone biosynthesis C-methylase UbiE